LNPVANSAQARDRHDEPPPNQGLPSTFILYGFFFLVMGALIGATAVDGFPGYAADRALSHAVTGALIAALGASLLLIERRVGRPPRAG
jgi:hypothetical protein